MPALLRGIATKLSTLSVITSTKWLNVSVLEMPALLGGIATA